MKMPLNIRFAGLEPSSALETAIRDRVAHLDRFAPDVMSCRVTVEQEARHQQQGRPFAVRVDLTLAGGEVSVSGKQNEDVYVALRDAIDAARRQLEDAVRIRRGDVKQHATPPAGGEAP
ncbi:MAG: ribosome-associated translation inhibitor RaiA [Burkholderiales bacterium]|nr:ribosome-associated translation inhibitor RaiA [Burkholderiales bacterium]